MATRHRWTRVLAVVLVGWVAVSQSNSAFAKKRVEPQLNVNGEALRTQYVKTLEALKSQIAAEIPAINAEKKAAFEAARAALANLNAPKEDAPIQARHAYDQAKAKAEADTLKAARAILADVKGFFASDKLDAKLVKAAILRHGTPAGLAEFAQQSNEHKALLDKLFADEALMKQMLAAGGANGGEYGEAMQVYTAILEASERAREPGILQNLALGTALHQPWLEGKDPGSVNGIVFTDHKNPDGQVARYLHYEAAYLAEELDPAFKDFSAWECRYITNDPYTNEELTWARKMLRNFRPDHITNPDHSWRYVGMVKSDFPYCSTRHDPTLGLPQQEALALGGVCGRRAFFGRFITRAFGIPARRSTQSGHAAMNMWTPDGWVVRLGAWWSMNWCGPWGGLDFFLDSRARAFPEEYTQVIRAQWIGAALGEEDVSIRHYGKGGGFWNGLAFYKKVAIVEDNKAAAVDEELASLTADEARLLGESDKILSQAEVEPIKISEEDKKIVVTEAGMICIPAVACTQPNNNTDKVAFLQSWGGGMQMHYQRLGNRPEILRYTINVPSAGDYELTAVAATVSRGQNAIFRVNRRLIVNVELPYSKGMWQASKPQAIALRKGRNTIMLSFRAPNRGVSLKEFRLKPVK